AKLIIEALPHLEDFSKLLLVGLKAGEVLAHVACRDGIAKLVFLEVGRTEYLRHLRFALGAQGGNLCTRLRVTRARPTIAPKRAFLVAIFRLQILDGLLLLGAQKTVTVSLVIGAA